jgi:hypothetical protein
VVVEQPLQLALGYEAAAPEPAASEPRRLCPLHTCVRTTDSAVAKCAEARVRGEQRGSEEPKLASQCAARLRPPPLHATEPAAAEPAAAAPALRRCQRYLPFASVPQVRASACLHKLPAPAARSQSPPDFYLSDDIVNAAVAALPAGAETWTSTAEPAAAEPALRRARRPV